MTGRLDGKVALITGAAAGLGRVAAELFAAEGAAGGDRRRHRRRRRGRRDRGRRRRGRRTSPPTSRDDASVAAAVAFAVETFGGAARALQQRRHLARPTTTDPTNTSDETWATTLDINVTGVARCCRHGIPAMLDSGGGSIVNVASFVAHLGAATPQIAYTASKGAVLSMTREIAVIYARQGIRANALCPGPVLTPLLAKFLSDDAKRQRRLVHMPMGRFGEPIEIANGALFLASDESSFMTGQSLLIDGGITAAYTTPE